MKNDKKSISNWLMILIGVIVFVAVFTATYYYYKPKQDFTQVKVGMTFEQVKDRVGEPNDVKDFFIAQHCFYDDNVIIISDNTVQSIQTKEQYKKGMEAMKNLMNVFK